MSLFVYVGGGSKTGRKIWVLNLWVHNAFVKIENWRRRTAWTREGEAAYKAWQEEHVRGERFRPAAGLHYEAVECPTEYITLPAKPELGVLRHRWVWEPRRVPRVPVFSKQKIPSGRWSTEENARLFDVYMGPWVIAEDDATSDHASVPAIMRMAYARFGKEHSATPRVNDMVEGEKCIGKVHRWSAW